MASTVISWAGLDIALFGTSRQLAVGPTSAISMLVGTTVAGMADGDPARWAGIAALTALVVAVIGGLAWLLRLSGLVNFISETILIGFKAGAALDDCAHPIAKTVWSPRWRRTFL